MPLAIKWSQFSKSNVEREANNYGVYELGDYNDVLYIGHGVVRSRLMAHFADGSDPIPGVSSYRVECTSSKERADQRENAELAAYKRSHGRLPRFNQRRR